jgi:hypothetical protein
MNVFKVAKLMISEGRSMFGLTVRHFLPESPELAYTTLMTTFDRL